MAQANIIFEDTEEGTKVGFNVNDIENQNEMTPALYNASLVAYIIENNYHAKFKEEFDRVCEEEEEAGE